MSLASYATSHRNAIRFNELEMSMASKANFSTEEWSRVVASPMVASTAITAADPSGLWGLLQEGIAGGSALLKAKQDASTNALVKAVVDDFANGDARTAARERVQTIFKSSQPADLTRRAVDELRSVASLLDSKAPEDSQAFKSWLQEIAQKAAEAAKEGGFLGFGGIAVSDAEKATLAEIAAALQSSSPRGAQA
jgi:hypothetical protein